jgi:hypothetical protein
MDVGNSGCGSVQGGLPTLVDDVMDYYLKAGAIGI